MPIKSGQRYKITNEENGLVFDITTAPWNWKPGINGRVRGWGFHGGGNQQWITERQDDGQWTIRSIETQKYFGFQVENSPKDGTLLDGLDEPQLWDIEVLPESEDHDNPRVRFWVRGTLLVAEIPKEKRDNGTSLQLWAATGGRNQVWVLEEYS